MAWSVPLTAIASTALTAAQWNASVRDNLLETAAAKATTAGSIFVGTGANALAERIPARQTNATAQTTASVATYGDLATVGPQVTVTTGAQAIVWFGAAIGNATAGGGGIMGFGVTGASTIVPTDDRAIRIMSGAAGETNRIVNMHMQIGLTPGSNTFTAKYTTPTGGTCTFQQREIGVIPL